MTTTALLIYPHQLYRTQPAGPPDRLHVLVEDPLFFGDARYPVAFHRQKLLLHRASMRRYAAETLAGQPLYYHSYAADPRPEAVFVALAARGITLLHVVDPTDDVLERRIRRYARQYGLALIWHDSPNFLTTPAELRAFFGTKTTYHQTDFYLWQRKRTGILLDSAGRPVGGRWTYDTENRQKLKAGVALPPPPPVYANPWLDEARDYVQQHFPQHPGSLENFIYPTGHAEAEAALHQFVAQRLAQFGPYQDALSTRTLFGFHALLSAPLNSGLLTPQQVLAAVLAAHADDPTLPLASLEGFIRQVLGWREFIRAVYVLAGSRQRSSNFFQHTRPLSADWYTGTTGLFPLDAMLHKLTDYACAHHIERLMVAGNLMVLCEIAPEAAYHWFMTFFIDAYDWVMVPNLYGMSLYADGGLMTTKPYISGSAYLRKMSDYPAGDWMATWDGLYWRFIHRHRAFFARNPRLAVMTAQLDRMGTKLNGHLQQAEQFLRRLSP
ncbi:MAG: cryptochrome/photolyase family protein [Anaerolineae bacterium]|jgi:deoxyribodipyrimidine photolyase-related protein|nr:cryptochrome/photolyase family protein [Anaerolineae bacterium]